MASIRGYGSEWDERRGQTKFWIELESGAGYAGYGDRLPAARLDMAAQMESIGLPLSALGSYGVEILAEMEGWARTVARFPGGQLAVPAYNYTRLMQSGVPITVEFAEGLSAGVTAVERVGTLHLPDGRVSAGDPYGARSQDAFTRIVEPGRYPVFVSWAEIEGEPRRRSVLAWIQFSTATVERWEQAVTEGQNPSSLAPGEMFGCPVDSGCAAFSVPGAEALEEVELAGGLEESAQSGEHLVAFTSGWGDGNYACFWGLDVHQQVAALVIDVALVGALKS